MQSNEEVNLLCALVLSLFLLSPWKLTRLVIFSLPEAPFYVYGHEDQH